MPAIIVSRKFAGVALSMAQCHQIASLLSCGCFKRSDSTLNLVNKDLLKSSNQCRASLPGRPKLQSVANLEYCDGTRPNGRASLRLEPLYHFPVRRVAHDRRQNVHVENDHRAKDAGSILYPRSSGISSSSPTLANSEAISIPRPPTAASRSFTAPMPCRAPSQPCLYLALDISNNKLSHHPPPAS